MSSALQATRHDLDQVRDALIELYLDVKVRPTDDVCNQHSMNIIQLQKLDDTSLEEERRLLSQ